MSIYTNIYICAQTPQYLIYMRKQRCLRVNVLNLGIQKHPVTGVSDFNTQVIHHLCCCLGNMYGHLPGCAFNAFKFPNHPFPICWSCVTSFCGLLVGCSSPSCCLHTHSSYLQSLFFRRHFHDFSEANIAGSGSKWLSSKNWMVCHSQNPGPIRQALIMGSPLSHSHCVKHPRPCSRQPSHWEYPQTSHPPMESSILTPWRPWQLLGIYTQVMALFLWGKIVIINEIFIGYKPTVWYLFVWLNWGVTP